MSSTDAEKVDAGAVNETSKSNNGDGEDSEVHSANSWETADLGDKSRNNKFLRLLGAKKKEHHGRFVIGDQEAKPTGHREKPEEGHVQEELEEQFVHGLEHRLAGGRKSHIGLGFHNEDGTNKEEDGKDEKGDGAKTLDEKKSDDNDGDKTEDVKEPVNDDDDKKDKSEKVKDESEEKETTDRKRESSDISTSKHEEVKKMKFVKSSSDQP